MSKKLSSLPTTGCLSTSCQMAAISSSSFERGVAAAVCEGPASAMGLGRAFDIEFAVGREGKLVDAGEHRGHHILRQSLAERLT